MTLKQMEYALVIAKSASLSEAAKTLFISQPSLSEAIKKLETELGFNIFTREKNGVSVTIEGEEFLNAAQSIVDQMRNIERQAKRHTQKTVMSSISAIHYFFMSEVFSEVINQVEAHDIEAYELRLLDSGTLEVIEDVANGTSEVGIISYTSHNKSYIMRELNKENLECNVLTSRPLQAFLRGGHPLSNHDNVTMKDLEPFAYASIWQNKSRIYYFTEEGIFLPANQKKILVKDCATMRTLLRETDAFAMGLGITTSDVDESETCALPVADAPITSVCWIRRKGQELSPIASEFLRICGSKLGSSIKF